MLLSDPYMSIDTLVNMMVRRSTKIETYYKELEAISKIPEMTDEQLAKMCTALGL